MGDSFDIRPLSGALGAEVIGADLRTLTDDGWDELHAAWLKHLVLVFRQQTLSPEDQVNFARRVGKVEIHPYLDNLGPEWPELTVFDSGTGQPAAELWHSDVTFSSDPPIASLLHMIMRPDLGGDTIWTNQYLVYESLSDPIRELVDGLTAVHTATRFGHPEQQATHSAVVVHPHTKRRALYVNQTFTSHFLELSRGESRALLAYLASIPEDPRLQCRVRWEVGDLIMWDNRVTQHYAVGDYDTRRVAHRATVLGQNFEHLESQWQPFVEKSIRGS